MIIKDYPDKNPCPHWRLDTYLSIKTGSPICVAVALFPSVISVILVIFRAAIIFFVIFFVITVVLVDKLQGGLLPQ